MPLKDILGLSGNKPSRKIEIHPTLKTPDIILTCPRIPMSERIDKYGLFAKHPSLNVQQSTIILDKNTFRAFLAGFLSKHPTYKYLYRKKSSFHTSWQYIFRNIDTNKLLVLSKAEITEDSERWEHRVHVLEYRDVTPIVSDKTIYFSNASPVRLAPTISDSATRRYYSARHVKKHTAIKKVYSARRMYRRQLLAYKFLILFLWRQNIRLVPFK